MAKSVPIDFSGAEENRIAGAFYAPASKGDAPPVLLVHGGGQTRHAWRGAARVLADTGFPAITIDQRGHGESDWVESQAYAFDDYAADLSAVARRIGEEHGRRPAVVGASLGGIASLLAEGAASDGLWSAIVLVDITPRMDPDGVAKVQGFMGARMREGFATLQDAARSIADYLPHRSPPKSLDGLAKNLRRDPDGRYRWHWDPAFLDGPRPINTNRHLLQDRLFAICRGLSAPALLVRGRQSELVTEEAAAEFRSLVPHAEFVDVSGAGHMVAGDRNDAFSDAVIGFLSGLRVRSEPLSDR